MKNVHPLHLWWFGWHERLKCTHYSSFQQQPTGARLLSHVYLLYCYISNDSFYCSQSSLRLDKHVISVNTFRSAAGYGTNERSCHVTWATLSNSPWLKSVSYVCVMWKKKSVSTLWVTWKTRILRVCHVKKPYLFRSGFQRLLLIGWLINLPPPCLCLTLDPSVNHVTFVTNELWLNFGTLGGSIQKWILKITAHWLVN